MWFRNLRLYRLPRGIGLDLADVDTRLARRPLTHCGNFEMVSRGWVFPRQEGAFVHAVGGQWLLALGVEQKLLPATVIRQTAQERAAIIEREQGRKVGRKEMRDLYERVMEELLPKAFSQRRTTWAWIDPLHGWLVVDAGSDARADEFMEVLLTTIDDLAPRPLQTQVSPSAAMTAWLAAQEPPAGFSFDSDLELRAASRSQSAIRYVHHDIGGPEIAAHIAAGKLVTRLGLTWNDKISFVLTDKLAIKRLAFLDVLKEQSEKAAAGADDQFDADFALMAGELARMFDDLLVALGGEIKPV
ncbi:recombination-associated protein RdgC [Sulfuricystis thermophila]|uniref:recombination-associated protein RdgC n=1 Tax=Sulfuricystis thermophila TaxID=2496847 RepID=UPI001035831A|nr:recombination-associated protein RdgC [Sulfuricystis thermophila]